MIVVTPERSTDQRLAALARANEIRHLRAVLKREIRAGRASVCQLLLDPPDYIETMKVADLLLVMWRVGRVKRNRVHHVCRISLSKPVGGLSERQRSEIVAMIRPWDTVVVPTAAGIAYVEQLKQAGSE